MQIIQITFKWILYAHIIYEQDYIVKSALCAMYIPE